MKYFASLFISKEKKINNAKTNIIKKCYYTTCIDYEKTYLFNHQNKEHYLKVTWANYGKIVIYDDDNDKTMIDKFNTWFFLF